jgi:hypothetical protein
VCYDSINQRVAKGEQYIGKVIRRNRESIVEPSIKTKVKAIEEKHGREGIEVHNS